MYCFQAEIRISANLRKTCAKNAEKRLNRNAREISHSEPRGSAPHARGALVKGTMHPPPPGDLPRLPDFRPVNNNVERITARNAACT